MHRIFLILVVLLEVSKASSSPVAPIPESEQAALAMAVIDAYHGSRSTEPPKKLHLVYFTPAEREPAAEYEQRLGAILEDIRSFYGEGMKRLGFGYKTFTLPRDAQGRLIIHLVKGKEESSAFPRWIGRNNSNTGAPEGGDIVKRACQPVVEAAGISFDRETVLIFCHLATYDEKAGTFRHHSPYFGLWDQQSGLCFAADWSNQRLDNLTNRTVRLNDGEYGNLSLGKHTTIFLGGIAHESGHAFALPHCGERWDEKVLGTSLLGGGNHTYREELRGEGKGSFLTMASAMRLASRPLFNGSDKNMAQPPQLEQCKVVLSTNVTRTDLAARRAALRVAGVVKGTPPVYGVIAYFDSIHDGGYRAPTATSVPDAAGQFAIEVSDLEPCANGTLRVEFCHANGAVSEQQLNFSVTSDGRVDLREWELRQALEPVAEAVAGNERTAAQAALRELEKGPASDWAKQVAFNLVGSLDESSRPSPADVPAETARLALGDARADSAEVGWLKPAANRIPPNEQITSPLLDSGKLYATGLYAHAPSRYVFDLGGKWKELSGAAGLHTLQQPQGSVVFIIKADDREVFRSATIRGENLATYKINLAGVRKLELLVDPAGDGNSNDWGLWLDSILTR
ncbi:MAG: NPCBM/NEW2 domain-containing protein [Verrucomicrobiota bacterium]